MTFLTIATSACSSSEPRPSVALWAPKLQAAFERLPGTWPHDVGSRRLDTCRRTVAVLEDARRRQYPTPTPALDKSFLAYINALLVFYRECPDDVARARVLHDKADALGHAFQTQANQLIDAASSAREVTYSREGEHL